MKIKTPKSIAKRVRVTKAKRKAKLVFKKAGQDHFNARESGKTTRLKRKNSSAAQADYKNIRRLLPYA